jgi:hypothetical protein
VDFERLQLINARRQKEMLPMKVSKSLQEFILKKFSKKNVDVNVNIKYVDFSVNDKMVKLFNL